MLRGELSAWLWDAVFPQFCGICEREGAALCASCEAMISTPGLFLAVEHSGLDAVRSLGKYEPDQGLGKLIELLKYQYAATAAEAVQRLVLRWFRKQTPLARPDMVIPIPLHRRRQAERGFNQAAVIAAAVAVAWGIPMVEGALVRHRATKQQAKLKRAERVQNLVAAFTVKKPTQVMGRQIWLVDDVYTTGSTMQAAAAALQTAGATVQGFTLARG